MATRGDFISNALSPLIQMAFRKRRCFSALINSPQSAYCLIPSSCHLNTVAHRERTGQSRLVPHHSPLRARVSCPLPVPAAAHHSTIPLLWHMAKPGGCPHCPRSASVFAFTHLCQITLPTAAGRNTHSQPLSPLRCPRSQGKATAALVFHLAMHPVPASIPDDARNYNRATAP